MRMQEALNRRVWDHTKHLANHVVKILFLNGHRSHGLNKCDQITEYEAPLGGSETHLDAFRQQCTPNLSF